MTETQAGPAPETASTSGWRSGLATAEIDSRMVGMVLATAVIWISFNILSDGDFLTARNLWNLSVQSTSIAIMATGMVLIIVSRNIDLSVGSLLGFLGYVMAMVQTRWIPNTFDLGLERWYTWIVALGVGLALGALVGAFQGFLVGFIKIPAFIVTLGGLLIWRGLIFRFEQGQTLSPLDSTFGRLGGGGADGSLGNWKSWLIGGIACALIIASVVLSRRRRQRYDLPLRPMWLDVGIGALGCLVVVAGIGLVANRYISPVTGNPTGIAYPVLILIMVTVLMTYLARRRQFGRYVYAYGGNPEAAELGGINTRKVIMLTFVLMGVLCAVSAAVQTARLDAAVTNLGVTNELDVISAAVIGGTSFAGGIGTIPGAVLGAIIMQSLRSGMVLLKVDSPMQDVVVGLVLIVAVGLDSTLRKGAK
jgi:D-xylose transport system permease protein